MESGYNRVGFAIKGSTNNTWERKRNTRRNYTELSNLQTHSPLKRAFANKALLYTEHSNLQAPNPRKRAFTC